jgi:hypothetical protein
MFMTYVGTRSDAVVAFSLTFEGVQAYEFDNDVIPDGDGQEDLGLTGTRWRELFSDDITNSNTVDTADATVSDDLTVTDDTALEGIVDLGTVESFADGDLTPSVLSGVLFQTANTSDPTLISDFDDGVQGQIIFVIFNDGATDIDCTASGIKCNVGVDITGAADGDHMECIYDGTDWYCDYSDNIA